LNNARKRNKIKTESIMREWLTVIVVLLIAGILLDGLRRMRQSRHGGIKMSRNIGQQSGMGSDKEDVDQYGSELPNGGARVIGGNGLAEDESSSHKPSVNEQVALNLDEDVPMLMDVDPEAEPVEPTLAEDAKASGEPLFTESSEHRVEPSFKNSEAVAETELPAEEVLVINVMAPIGTYLAGEALLDVVLSCGMRFGDMNIFHRHETESGEGPILFSMANMVKPGYFNLNTMDVFETPGISLFMSLPMSGDSLQAFDLMAQTAHALQVQLGGELKDENRSVMTQQTLEHSRQRIREFERKQLSRVPV